MRCINRVTLLGHVGQAPKIGNGVARFSVATTESWKDRQSGEWKEKTTWTNVVAFGKKAEYVGKNIGKGTPVYVEGRGESGEYQKDGQTVRTWEVNLDNLVILPKVERSTNGDARPEHAAPAPASTPVPAHGTGGFDDEDYPF